MISNPATQERAMTDRRYRYAVTALFGVLLATEPAFAQIAGGGGQGLLN
jgi:hypothetical protein